MDAFGTAHRAEGSTHGVARFAKVAAAGPLLAAELDALGKALGNPARPMAAIVAGSKVSTKLDVLNSLAGICDQLIVGGGIANTFLAAAGHKVGKSLYEADLVETAKAIAAKVSAAAGGRGGGQGIRRERRGDRQGHRRGRRRRHDPRHRPADRRAVRRAAEDLEDHPVERSGRGVRVRPVRRGHPYLANAIADSAAFSIAGGGDTLAAIDKYGIAERISYISTGGGAFLEFVEGKVLPAVEILEQRAKG